MEERTYTWVVGLGEPVALRGAISSGIGIRGDEQIAGVQSVLGAAAWTYVAAAVSALGSWLFYIVLLFSRPRVPPIEADRACARGLATRCHFRFGSEADLSDVQRDVGLVPTGDITVRVSNLPSCYASARSSITSALRLSRSRKIEATAITRPFRI